MDTIYGIAHILSCSHNEAKSNENHDGDTVVQSEHWRVDVYMADFDEVLQTPENVQHVAAGDRLELPHDNRITPRKYESATVNNCLKCTTDQLTFKAV